MFKLQVSQLANNSLLSELDVSLQKQVKGGYKNENGENTSMSFFWTNRKHGENRISHSIKSNNVSKVVKYTQSGIKLKDSKIIQNGNNSVSVNHIYS